MTSLQRFLKQPAQQKTSSDDAVSVYESLLRSPADLDRQVVRQFLDHQIDAAKALPSNLPATINDLSEWVAGNARAVAERYSLYLAERRAGGLRKFFKNKAHALYFLQNVAPSKLVDGAWLYGTVKHANDWRYHALIRTYLEELGDGEPALNHVLLYRNLLTEHDCAPTRQLEASRYLQGAIQLALGEMSDDFLPEVLGYNLGYEQLPLHLLITAFELKELGIDPYYFTLHVTIDNASSGHAHKAVEAILDLVPSDGTKAEFLQRMRNGYLLNDLGTNSVDVIESFDLEQQVVAMLENKSTFGQHMHSDYCRLEGRTINEWLATRGQSKQFLNALENKGWIKRNQDPQASRFWQLIDGPGAVMFGVFSGYEMQLLKDWIAGDWREGAPDQKTDPFRANFRRRPVAASASAIPDRKYATHLSLQELVARLAPGSHPTPDGLIATQAYAQRLAQGCLTP